MLTSSQELKKWHSECGSELKENGLKGFVTEREREKINDYDLDIILVTFLVTVTPTVHINNGSMDLVYLQLELYV